MVEVRIRRESDASALHLGEVEFTKKGLDSVIPLITSWGISVDGEASGGLCGQFVLDDSGAFFEIFVTEDEA